MHKPSSGLKCCQRSDFPLIFHFISHREYCPFIDPSTFRYCIQKRHISCREYCPLTALSTFHCCLQKHHNHFISCREYFPFVDLRAFHYPLQKQHHDHFISCREYCPFNDLSTFCHCLQKQLNTVCCICDIYYSMPQKVIPQFAGICEIPCCPRKKLKL